MTHCLICNRPQARHPAAGPFICAHCVQDLARISTDRLTEFYTKAVRARQWGRAYGLYTFVPRRVRKKHPLPRNVRKLITQAHTRNRRSNYGN